MAQQCRDRDITITPTSGSVTVMFNGKEVASTSRALDLKEGENPTVIYVPLSDVNETFLAPSEHTSICPYKGEASYYDLMDGAKISPEAVWFYLNPCPLVEKIRDHVAFWGDDITYVSAR